MIVKICKKHGDLTRDKVCEEPASWITKGGEKKTRLRFRCIQCRRDKDKKWTMNNLDKKRLSSGRAKKEARRLYREGLTDIEPKVNIWTRKDRQKNPERYREQSAKSRKKLGQLRNTQEVCRRLNWTVDDYYKMHTEQNGRCAICKEIETRKSRTYGKICALAIDHNHATGKIRKLLCHNCNVLVGHCKESIDLLEKAIEYLKEHTI